MGWILDGKVAIVTGGARGQGRAEARRLAEEGAAVVVSDVVDDEGEAVADEIGERAVFVHHDVTSEDSWTALVAATVARFGRIDVLLNNAGILKMGSILEIGLDDYDATMSVNSRGPFLGIRTVAPVMQAGTGGSIVNTSSTAGLRGAPGVVAYATSKWALRGLTKVAAIELAPFGVRVNSVHPGIVDTPFVDSILEGYGVPERPAGMGANQPIARMCRPEEVAELMVFLASDQSSYCTGAEFVIDGGSTALLP